MLAVGCLGHGVASCDPPRCASADRQLLFYGALANTGKELLTSVPVSSWNQGLGSMLVQALAFAWVYPRLFSTAPGDWLASQYLSANVSPSDRYTLSLPGTPQYRISPLDRTYDNLTIAGDWTSCGLDLGCVESAVMSGMLAAHAISGSPGLHEIVGFDHA